MLKKIGCLVIGLCLLPALARSEMYKWTDEKGGVHLSDRPPPVAPKEVSGQSSADQIWARSFPVPRHGNLILSVPEPWKQDIRQPPDDLPPTIMLTPRQGDEFEVRITPLWSPKNEPGFNNPQAVKRLISADLAGMLPSAVERNVPIEEIRGKQGTGYTFFMTDKAPKPGEYPYVMRAGIGVGDLLLSATVLCRAKDSEGIRQTIRALEAAIQAKAEQN